MSAKVSAEQLKEVFCRIATTNFDLREQGHKPMFPILIIGEKGIGKTELIPEFAKHLEEMREERVHTHFITLSTQDTADLLGMPFRKDLPNGKMQTGYAAPEWLPYEESEDCHIVVCDEFNRAPGYVLQTMLPFSLGGTLHTHKLPTKSLVVFLANPANDDYVVNNFSDSAFYDRMARFNYAPTHHEWWDHAEKNNVSNSVIATTKKMTKLLSADYVADEYDINVPPSNRTFTKLGLLMSNIDGEWLDEYGSKLASAYVGDECALAIMKEHRNLLDKTLKPSDILKHIDKHTAWISEQANSEKYESGKLGEININLRRHLANNFDKVRKDTPAIKNFCTYLTLIGKDQLCEFVVGLQEDLSKDPEKRHEVAEFFTQIDLNIPGLLEVFTGEKTEA